MRWLLLSSLIFLAAYFYIRPMAISATCTKEYFREVEDYTYESCMLIKYNPSYCENLTMDRLNVLFDRCK